MFSYLMARRARNPAPRTKTTPARRGRRSAPARTRRKRKARGAWRRAWRLFGRLPSLVQGVVALVLLALLAVATNFVVQVVRKPTELFFPVEDALHKTPRQTWAAYGRLFEKHSTRRISPELLAALAQVEASGNPVARTYWRFSWTSSPFDIYRPASTAVGMYQFTNGTFEQARRYCVHNHEVVEDGPWHDLRSCWFNALYMRTVPSHAIEMTSAYLDRAVANILTRQRISNATPRQVGQLAAVIHLCGAGAGNTFARRGFSLATGQRCGDHSVATYVTRVERYQAMFRGMRQASSSSSSGSSLLPPVATASS